MRDTEEFLFYRYCKEKGEGIWNYGGGGGCKL